jgi:hypothetical protein
MAILFGLIIPGLLLANIQGEFSLNVLLVFGIVIWCTLRLTYAGLRGQRRLTLMCFYVFTYVFFGIQPLLSVWSRSFPYALSLSDGLVTFTIMLVILGIAAFESGYCKLRLIQCQESTRQCTSASYLYRFQPISSLMFWLAIVAVTVMTILIILYYGPGLFLGIRGFGFISSEIHGPQMSQPEWLLVVYTTRVLSAILLLILLYYRKVYLALPGFKLSGMKAAIVLLGILNITVSNPLNAPRLWFGGLLLTVFFVSSRWKGRRSFLIWTAVGSVCLLLLFSGTDPRRIIAQPLQHGEAISLYSISNVIDESINRLPIDGNFDAFQMIALTSLYTDNFGYSWGRQLLLPAFFWVPRSIWNKKPVGTSLMVAEHLSLPNLNVSCPLWAEGYMNFGVFGLALFLFIFGKFARVSDDFLAHTFMIPASVFHTIISCFFAANTFILLRGDLTTGTMYLQMMIGFTFLILLKIRRKSRKYAASHMYKNR